MQEGDGSLKSLLRSSSYPRQEELENFLLYPEPLKNAVVRRISERNKRAGTLLSFDGDIGDLLTKLTEPLRHRVEAKYLARRRPFEKSKASGLDDSTIDEKLMGEFDLKWKELGTRLLLVPGKEVLSNLNSYLQALYGVTITPSLIVDCFVKDGVPVEMNLLINRIEEFRKTELPEVQL